MSANKYKNTGQDNRDKKNKRIIRILIALILIVTVYKFISKALVITVIVIVCLFVAYMHEVRLERRREEYKTKRMTKYVLEQMEEGTETITLRE